MPAAKLASRSNANRAPSSSGKNIMATDTALDSDLVEKAVQAVLKYHENASKESSGKLALLGDDRPVHVQFTLLRAPGQSRPKPTQIVVPHPFFKLAEQDNEDEVDEPEICLIVKESSKPWCQEMIEKFPDHMGCVKKVLTLDSLRKKYTSYQQKRELLHKYNMFMADDRILPMLSKALGKAFIQTKRLPIPIDLTRQKALPFAIQKALSATYMTVNTGTCITIRAGHTGMDSKKIVENIVAITEKAVPKMPRKWSNVQLIGVKTADSISLPVYNKTPEALREIAILAGIKPDVHFGGAAEKSVEKKLLLEDDSQKDVKNTKKRASKSPLLQALKKQKKDEQVEKKTSEPSKKKSAAAEKKAKDDAEKTLTEPKSTKKASSAKESSKKRTKKQEPKEEAEDKTESPKKKQKVEKSKKTKAEEQNEKEDTGSKKDFIKAKKFKGSKKGYVFKMGREGLGYYVDVKPQVDRDAMEAILRLGKNKSRRGGQKKNKYKGTRRF